MPLVDRTRRVAICFAVLAFSVACEGEQPAKPPDATHAQSEADASTQPPAETATPGEATSIQETMKQKLDLPPEYPPDGLVYPDTRPSQVDMRDDGTVFAIFATKDEPMVVLENITDDLEAKGWQIDQQERMSHSEFLQASKSGRRQMVGVANISDHAGDATRLIAVTIFP